MTAQQTNAKRFNPNQLDLVKVASYERIINAPLERVWENVLDWEHLPWLHNASFGYIEVEDAGQWGWRTWSSEDHKDHIELVIADGNRYVARSYLASQQVSEIWTMLEGNGPATRVNVDFHLANVRKEDEGKLGKAMIGLYTRLWDEDEAMMIARHQRLHEKRNDASEVELGRVDDLRARIEASEPVIFQLERREYQLRLHEDELVAHHTICPHLLGPLDDSDISDGELTCPWHGFRFSLSTGECTFPAHATCRLSRQPELIVTDGRLTARHAQIA
jgi:nitrite reductase/ring-hydroxylating ferredoxin subunit